MSESERAYAWADGRAMGLAQLVGGLVLLVTAVTVLFGVGGDVGTFERVIAICLAFAAGGMVQESASILRRL